MIHYNWQIVLLLLICRLVPAPFFFFKNDLLAKRIKTFYEQGVPDGRALYMASR